MAYSTLKDLGIKSPYKEKYDNFIGGKWVKPVDGKYFENITPISGKPFCEVARSNEKDIELALDACKRMGNNNIALLKCTSSYPAPINEANMCMIKDLASRFDVISGLSDHTLGTTVPIVATVFGAKIIEKHFILDRSIGGADSSFSMDESEFTEMVKAVREAEKAIGKVNYKSCPCLSCADIKPAMTMFFNDTLAHVQTQTVTVFIFFSRFFFGPFL